MLSVCFYFQVHQPFRIKPYNIFNVGTDDCYFDEVKNRAVLQKVARKCYLPTNQLLKHLLQKHPSFKVAFSLSGVFLEQCELYAPEVLESFQELVATNKVELLAETYYHSLAFIYSIDEFKEQIRLHADTIKKLFGKKPTILRNTELIYHNDVALVAHDMGYKGVLMEGADHILGWRSPNFIYTNPSHSIKLLCKNYRLSDDIAFRFSERSWKEFPLTAPKFASWVNNVHGNGTHVNLFMDYETFGEHQWDESGIFHFMNQVPAELIAHPDTTFCTPSELVDRYDSVGTLDVPFYVSWADIERDLSAWCGNAMQHETLHKLYQLEEILNRLDNRWLKKTWRLLQTSDLFYYMCVKWFNDGDVHKYFSPYESPYDAYIYFMNVLQDFSGRIQQAMPTKKRSMKKRVASIRSA